MTFEEKITTWIAALPALDGFIPQVGALRETGSDPGESFICFYRDGGRQTGPDNAFPRVKFWLYSQQEAELISNRLSEMGEAIDSLFNYATAPLVTCGFISSKVLGGIIGPKLTENGRATYGLTVEFID